MPLLASITARRSAGRPSYLRLVHRQDEGGDIEGRRAGNSVWYFTSSCILMPAPPPRAPPRRRSRPGPVASGICGTGMPTGRRRAPSAPRRSGGSGSAASGPAGPPRSVTCLRLWITPWSCPQAQIRCTSLELVAELGARRIPAPPARSPRPLGAATKGSSKTSMPREPAGRVAGQGPDDVGDAVARLVEQLRRRRRRAASRERSGC